MSVDSIRLDSEWIAANPLPVHGLGTTKNSRGRVLAIGASRQVPGALRLTGEAALRVGAGKLQMAVPASIALPLGLLTPEAAVIALPEDDAGEIDAKEAGGMLDGPMDTCDAVVVGPGVSDPDGARQILKLVLDLAAESTLLVIDAMTIGCLRDLSAVAVKFRDRIVLTPHYGEMAVLTGRSEEDIANDPATVVADVADQYGAVVVLKGSDTVIGTPDGTVLYYGGGGTGLATGGSGDVLAGAIGGLLARGTAPLIAAGWGVWLHGQAARRVATARGPIGFLAREVASEFPRLLPQ